MLINGAAFENGLIITERFVDVGSLCSRGLGPFGHGSRFRMEFGTLCFPMLSRKMS